MLHQAMDLKQLEAADRIHIHFLLVGDDQVIEILNLF
jgi:hypothetical protein